MMTLPAWDGFDAYLFDIDGTLMNATDAVHYFAFCEALTTLAGRPMNLDGVNAHGNTDVGILRDAMQLAAVPDEEWRPRLAETQAQMCAFVGARTADLRITVLPAVEQILNHLHARGATLGVATGNLEGIGRAKLGHAGLLRHFDFFGFSDLFEYRRDVFRAALSEAHTLTNPQASVCVVGDTPEDIRAAKANSLPVIATATGIFSFEQLKAERPDWCLHSLAELLEGGTSDR
jgi:phosphoglycolate phosphatase